MNPYDVLGVPPQASAEEITSQFKILVQIFHPDRFMNSPAAVRNEAERRMKQLNEAYLALRTGSNRPMDAGFNGSRMHSPPSGAWKEPPARTTRVSWDQSERQRAAQARKAEEARLARERSAGSGTARSRPKAAGDPLSVVFGLGRALPTGRLSCRGCGSSQTLPAGWQNQLDTHNFFCSTCDRLILAVERNSPLI